MQADHEDGLFADPRPAQRAAAPVPDPDALPDWRVASLRMALDALGLETMAERQKVIEELAGRPVPSLRDLTFPEARAIAEQLAARQGPGGTTGNAWDNRDETTWIDQL